MKDQFRRCKKLGVATAVLDEAGIPLNNGDVGHALQGAARVRRGLYPSRSCILDVIPAATSISSTMEPNDRGDLLGQALREPDYAPAGCSVSGAITAAYRASA